MVTVTKVLISMVAVAKVLISMVTVTKALIYIWLLLLRHYIHGYCC